MAEKKDEVLIFKSRSPIWAKFIFRLGSPSVVKEILVSEEEIVLKAFYGDYHYKWKEILEAFTVTQTARSKSSAGLSERYLILRAPDNRRFRFGSMEFEKGNVLINKVLPLYLKISNHKYKEIKWLYYFCLLVWVGLLFVFVKTDNWIYPVCDVASIFIYFFYLSKLNEM